MKNFAIVSLGVLLLGIIFFDISKFQKQQFLDKLSDRQIELLRDQVREYEYKISTIRTYEDGYKDAIIKSGRGTYADGFEAAKLIYKNADYTLGYHSALTQYGYQKNDEVVKTE